MVALTFAPETRGAPSFTDSPAPTSSTSPKEIAAPTSPARLSTRTCSPDWTLYCLPPDLMIAYMIPALDLYGYDFDCGYDSMTTDCGLDLRTPCVGKDLEL